MLEKGSVAPKLGPPRGLARGTGLGDRVEGDVDWNSDRQVACWRWKDKRERSECVSEGDSPPGEMSWGDKRLSPLTL